MDGKNVLLAIVLSSLVLVVWATFFEPPVVEQQTVENEITKKESNRINEMKNILIQAGIRCKSTQDSMIIYGKNKIDIQKKSVLVKTKNDHRICMSSVIFSLLTGLKTKITNFETVNTSFPGFIKIVKSLGGKIEIK